MAKHLVRWGAIGGGVGFVGGYVGPMIFAPEVDNRLVLGLIAGVVGFLLGAIWAGVYWAKMSRDRDDWFG